jgi:hypothetical protein
LAELFCRKCGADIQESDESCAKCGEKVIKKNPGIIFVGLFIGVLVASLMAYKVVNSLSGISKAQSMARLNICQANMRTISTALDTYRAEIGRYPSNLKELCPRYINKVPVCSAAGFDKYTCSYKADQSGNSYVFYCSGSSHKDYGLAENFPQYYSGSGVVLKPEDIPAKTKNGDSINAPTGGSGGSGELLDIPRPPKPRVPDIIRKGNPAQF